MEVKTYRARNMLEALQLVRRDLGPDAAILRTREVHGGPLLRWIPGLRQIEITAALDVHVPSRLPERDRPSAVPAPHFRAANLPAAEAAPTIVAPTIAAAIPINAAPADPAAKAAFRDEVRGQLSDLQAMVEDLCRRSQRGGPEELPQGVFQLFTELLDADVPEALARELAERVAAAEDAPTDDPALLKTRASELIESEIDAAGPIVVTPGKRRLVALVGPTGVGKTTTIAKLAANFQLRDKHRVGLITVDTYRIAAVEQLRTYADIIDLPMEVVSTPREMRAAVERLAHLDLILLDTAGRSPTDEIKIQELKAFLNEAAADEVHLVLSCVAGAQALERTAKQFVAAGANGLILTKLDEAAGLGNVLPLLRGIKLPLRYLTDGQNVPDDISAADARRLARRIVGMHAD